MIGNILKSIFGSRNERTIKRMQRVVAQINQLEDAMVALADEALQAKTVEFRERLAKGETLDQLLPEAFAVVREASKRVLNMRHFDVQLVGGMVLHEGKIAEMRTGEGKTLVATLPVYLNALTGKGVHVVTVNDYLARRDAEWMGRLYRFLGLTVGVVVPNQEPEEKFNAYRADISYCTNNELGFDYLRDNMSFNLSEKMQRPLSFAVVDEVDSILVDEARTPLIISGPAAESSELYKKLTALVPLFTLQKMQPKASALQQDAEIEVAGDYTVDEKNKTVLLTETGHEKVEDILIEQGLLAEGESLYDANNLRTFHHLECCLKAHVLYRRDVEYIVRDGQVIIVDEFTGRTLAGRRWSDGLHQAVEAKENVTIQAENQTLASITFQNYFRIYDKLAGMTGTADTEAPEFLEIYGLEVVVVPTNRKPARQDFGDLVYLTQQEKYDAIVKDIVDCHQRGQPVLVGTASIEVSELISTILTEQHIRHEVLNAKQHEREAQIVAHAGMPAAVTIATNMAGRGTDIVLGGNLSMMQSELGESASESEKAALAELWEKQHQQVLEVGGLHIIGTERHESRRIDNQLRGRAGRQGDPGSSRFYLSLQDSLMRIFASDRVSGMMAKLGMGNGEAIEHPWVSRSIENAQRKVEGHNFDIRKNLLQYDNVANDQRRVIYKQRDQLLAATDVYGVIESLRDEVLNRLVMQAMPPETLENQWDIPTLVAILAKDFGLVVDVQSWLQEDAKLDNQGVYRKLCALAKADYDDKVTQLDTEQVRQIEKTILLQTLDTQWKDHLAGMDYLRQGIHLRSYAQKKPEQEYKKEAFMMFEQMLNQIQYETVGILSRAQVEAAPPPPPAIDVTQLHYEHADLQDEESVVDDEGNANQPYHREMPKVGRNEACPCGSGKKYKQCHGKLTS